jgi:hypothetical protein
MFLGALKQALNVRLQNSQHIFGEKYTAELRIAELRRSVPGAIVKIVDTEVVSVEEYVLSHQDLKPTG